MLTNVTLTGTDRKPLNEDVANCLCYLLSIIRSTVSMQNDLNVMLAQC